MVLDFRGDLSVGHLHLCCLSVVTDEPFFFLFRARRVFSLMTKALQATLGLALHALGVGWLMSWMGGGELFVLEGS
jgi:hypothetical protein